jgi:hypothetical protein
MKKPYIKPDVEIVEFETEDVITTSSWTNGNTAQDYNNDGDIQFP